MRTDVPQAVVTLRLLKSFTLLVDERRVTLSSSAQRLLAFLALQDRPRTRTYVARTLWPEATTARANANLRSSLWRASHMGHRVIEASTHEMALANHTGLTTSGCSSNRSSTTNFGCMRWKPWPSG
jgi:DNA-binding SARP family transcriptional activator